MQQIRLNKYLSTHGLASRRKVDQLISLGKIKINSLLAGLGDTVDPQSDQIYVEDQLFVSPKPDFVYILLNKPAGYVTSSLAQSGQKTVLDLVRCSTRVFPVGRLDKDTTGLLLLTNDGQLAHELTHPRFEKNKTYQVSHQGATAKQLRQLQSGVVIDHRITSTSQIEIISKSLFEITIHEGRNRQIRKMCQAVGIVLTNLKRVSFHGLLLGNLLPGQWRYLSPGEISLLRR